MGTESTLRQARTALSWPEMNTQLKHFIASCETFKTFLTKNQKETMIGHDIPNIPWSKIASDIFEWNKEHFIVFVDYYSDRIEFDKMRNQTTAEIIDILLKQYARYGIPNEIFTDFY